MKITLLLLLTVACCMPLFVQGVAQQAPRKQSDVVGSFQSDQQASAKPSTSDRDKPARAAERGATRPPAPAVVREQPSEHPSDAAPARWMLSERQIAAIAVVLLAIAGGIGLLAIRAGVCRPVVVICGLAVLVLGSGTAVVLARQHEQRIAEGIARAKAEAEARAKERELLGSLLADHPDFAVCRFYNFEFIHNATGEGSDCPPGGVRGYCNISKAVWTRQLRLLAEANYIATNPDWLLRSGVPFDALMWRPTARATAAVGTTIGQQRIFKQVPIRVPNLSEYNWKLILGCREFLQIDATTPLADGSRIDFSWHWKPTELGTADGLSDARERGEAYIRKVPNGWVADKIYFKKD